MKKFNEWLALKLGNGLSSMLFFYICLVLDLVELPPVIAAHSVIIWCTYLSQSVIQLVALPILGVQQRIMTDHHEMHSQKLDKILNEVKLKKDVPSKT